MSDMIKKGFLLGLGAALTSKEKVEKYIEELAIKGQVAPTEISALMEELIKKGEKQGTEWDEEMRSKIQSLIRELGFVTEDEFRRLEERVAALEQEDGHV